MVFTLEVTPEVADAMARVLWASARVPVDEVAAVADTVLASRSASRLAQAPAGLPVSYAPSDPSRILASVAASLGLAAPAVASNATAATVVLPAAPPPAQPAQPAPCSSPSEACGVSVEPLRPLFGLGSRQAPVGEDLSDALTLSNASGERVAWRIDVPQPTHKMAVAAAPLEGSLGPGKSARVELTLRVHCTTKAAASLAVHVSGRGGRAGAVCPAVVVVAVESQLTTRLDRDELPLVHPAIGDGSFGVVYRSEYRGLPVAVKVLKNQKHMSPQALEDFKAEVRVMEKLRHPSIVNFIGAVHEPGCLALVTEFCPYGSVPAVLDRHPVSYALKLRILLDCSRGMDFLHRSGIMHRDLKPDNLLVASLEPLSSGVCRIADFGTTRDINRMAQDLQATKGVGTPMYMAPELLSGEPYAQPADVYSFALVMYYVAAEAPPMFDDPALVCNAWQYAAAVRAGRRPTLSSAWAADYVALMTRCWVEDAASRPCLRSAAALRMEKERARVRTRMSLFRGVVFADACCWLHSALRSAGDQAAL
eukprot:m51a1_g7846 putative serine-threonine protein (537) ;mRNA; r:217575-219979